MPSSEGIPFPPSDRFPGNLNAITISAKATPITNPRFLARANKLEAKPTFSRGKEPMMALLLAGLKSPIPMPRRICLHKISKSFAPVCKKVKEKTAREVRAKPVVAGILTPIRSEILPPKGAITITVRETGKMRIPTFEGEYSKIFWRKKGMTKLCAPFIQKEKKPAPREEVKSRLLKKLRSTNGDGDRSSTRINRLEQIIIMRKSHAHRRGSDPRPIRLREKMREVTKRKSRKAPQKSTRALPMGAVLSRTFEER
jgi:hypothetical protein